MWKIIAIGAVLTGVQATLINERVKPLYESSSLLRVEPARIDLFDMGRKPAEEFEPFLQTQVELLRSPTVLSAALAEPKVTSTTLIAELKDPENELRGRLQVNTLGGTYLIRVALSSTQPEDGPVIVNEVVKAYLKAATKWSAQKNDTQIQRLKAYREKLTRLRLRPTRCKQEGSGRA